MKNPTIKEINNAVIIEPMIQATFMLLEWSIYYPVHAGGGLTKFEQAA